MELRRDIIAKLAEWRERPGRLPLIIQGARQIGKTWVMKRFGELYYKHTAYFNFEVSPDLCRDFAQTKDPHRLLDILKLYSPVPIDPRDTLLIFDEIQQSNEALNSLKYFSEEAPEYSIIAAGSLLGVSLSRGEGFPVGKVEFMKMYPVSFREFLSVADPVACEWLDNLDTLTALPAVISGRVSEAYSRYGVCGGMPKAAVALLEGAPINEIEEIQQGILTAYALDFAKHAPSPVIPRIAAVWESIPSQLARENRKFVYKLVKNGARAREYEDALLWLQHAGLVYRIFCISKPGLPLSAYDDLSAFKLYLFDSGLLRVLAKLPAEMIFTDNPLFQEFKGALAENMVLQALVPQLKAMPRYWVSNGTAEVDFVIQDGLEVYPIEVKAGTNTAGKSLSVYISKYEPPLAIIFSDNPLEKRDGVLRVPRFMADWTTQILRLASKP